MATTHHAAESLTLAEAQARLPASAAWISRIFERIRPYQSGSAPLRVLEIGAAQGRGLIALAKLGHQAYGIEPAAGAREVAEQLAQAEGCIISIEGGSAEHLPYEDGFFDVVVATSVLEHVTDLEQSLSEVSRVLRPGGLFWFYTASAMCPSQGEIGGFPLFGWYPDRLKLRIMNWAKTAKPHLVGFTETPAIHWWTPWKARRVLGSAGFDRVWDRWQLRLPDEDQGWRRDLVRVVRNRPPLRLACDVAFPDCSYLARKAGAHEHATTDNYESH